MRLAEACTMDARPWLAIPSLEETAAVVWSVQALALCGDAQEARRWAFGKFLAARRRAGPVRPVTVPAAEIESVFWAALFTLVEPEDQP